MEVLEMGEQKFRIKDEFWKEFQSHQGIGSGDQEGWLIEQEGMGDSILLYKYNSDGNKIGPFRCPKNGYEEMTAEEPMQEDLKITITKRVIRVPIPSGLSPLALQVVAQKEVMKLFKDPNPPIRKEVIKKIK